MPVGNTHNTAKQPQNKLQSVNILGKLNTIDELDYGEQNKENIFTLVPFGGLKIQEVFIA